VAAAIAGFNALPVGGRIPRPDLLIVARGGGSIEDLWAFNEEITVRAVANSAIPVITAVGHETDTTLVDFASDHRAPTPTAAAERAVPVLADLRLALTDLGLRGDRAALRWLALRRERLAAVARRQPSPRTLLGLRQQRFDDIADRLPRSLRTAATVWRGRLDRLPLRPRLLVARRDAAATALARASAALAAAAAGAAARDRQALTATAARLRLHLLVAAHDRGAARVDAMARLLESYSPLNILGRGYALVTDRAGHVVTSAAAARTAAAMTLTFADARVDVTTGVPVQGKLF
jgi:exodeoxyribonuclease VII large subunit